MIRSAALRAFKLVLAALAAAGAAACASVTVGGQQSVMMSTRAENGQAVDGAECKLANDKGNWTVKTPAAVKVTRSAEDLQLECSRDGHRVGLAKAISRAHGGMFGNILIGGGIGAIIDHSSGTGYDYPDVIEVVMGKSVVRDRNDQRAESEGSERARQQ